ncbi:hypothetical protein ACFQ0Q_27595 [Streptomyces aureus]
MGRKEEAIALFEGRAAMGGWPEEVYFSQFQAGVLKAETGDWPGAMDAFVHAWETRPQRLEACYQLCSRLRSMGHYRAAHAFASAGLDQPVPDDLLFVSPWVYRWGLLFEFSITAYCVGDWEGSYQACDRLLAMPDLPEAIRKQTLANREFPAQHLSKVWTSFGRWHAPAGAWAGVKFPPDFHAATMVSAGSSPRSSTARAPSCSAAVRTVRKARAALG